MSLIKGKSDITKLRRAGKYLAQVLKKAQDSAREGITLLELDRIIHEEISALGGQPSFLGYDGFPNASCLSLNNQVVHGIPSDYSLKSGDILGIDVGLWYNEVCVDAAITVVIDNVSQDIQRLVKATQQALTAGIKATKPYGRIGAISHAIEEVANQYDLGIIKNLTGHGVGHQVHEEPSIPNYGHPSDGIIIKPGMVLAIEPMFSLGSGSVQTETDGWTIATADHSLSAHFEHTILVTSDRCEILTKL